MKNSLANDVTIGQGVCAGHLRQPSRAHMLRHAHGYA
jgi:hypothetical protein